MLTSLPMLLLSAAAAVCVGDVTLRHLSTEYLPEEIDDSDGSKETYEFNSESVRKMAFDSTNPYIYTVGLGLVHVLDYADPDNMLRVGHYVVNHPGACTDVEACGDRVAVSYVRDDLPQGRVYVFQAFNGSSLNLLQEIDVERDPSSLKFTNDCKKLLVTIRGQVQKVSDDVIIDPEGIVHIITFQPGIPGYDYKLVGFSKFNSRAEEYEKKGVRWPWHGQNTNIITTFSGSLEPASMTLNSKGTIAYVTLQTNNAIATLDIEAEEFLEIYPLGLKSWNDITLDTSDKDGGINMTSWDIYSLYQPSDITLLTIDGVDYLATADAGSDLVYTHDEHGFSWTDSMRGKDLVNGDLLDDSVTNEMREYLTDDSKLGRLQFSVVDGLSSGKISQLVCFGGRGVSIFTASDMKLVHDSGDLLERTVASEYPELFNVDTRSMQVANRQHGFDGTSDRKGPEPDSVAYAAVNIGERNRTRRLLFVGTKNPGIINLFNVPRHLQRGGRAQLWSETVFMYAGWVSVVHTGIAVSARDLWKDLWKSRISRDLGPEDMQVLPASRSPNKEPLLAVVGAVSGTVSLYAICEEEDKKKGLSVMAEAGIYFFCAMVLLVLIALVTFILAEKRRKNLKRKRADPERKSMIQLTDTAAV